MYFFKTKGTANIFDYIQVRDENFVLLAHFSIKNLEKNIIEIFRDEDIEILRKKIQNTPFGKLQKINIKNKIF